ncbi:hypothetical protein KQ944_18340 [Bacillus subtilis]|uniref:hypothetical protein n=1 Tax=Pseudochrobactrum asaccharolyticum TaxID=354351 RepID=UPI001F29B5F2|nr:hypothetical protein [Pseudochrobactrum asaccharolyticum]MCF7647309.1 hypothetical protein [Pseudochrobactrum asaccharolyticum]MCF7673600.1 hypothetical protein [Bacillus subtilis]
MDIMTGIAAAAQALDIAKKLKEISNQYKDAEFKLQAADLYSALADVKIALADAKTLLQEKETEIARLSAIESGKFSTKTIGAYQFGIGEDGKLHPRAFCPSCLSTNGHQNMITRGVGGHNICPACKAVYTARETNLPSGANSST